jgi:transcriptional regulator with XRE-family HTH domain
MKERILEFLKAENKSSAQFAEDIGVQPSGISHILSGRNNPSLDFILKMLEKYKYLSTEWLLFGKGTMYKESKMQSLFDQDYTNQELSFSKPVPQPEEPVMQKDNDRKENFQTASSGTATSIERIIWFYSDKSFREFFPDK